MLIANPELGSLLQFEGTPDADKQVKALAQVPI